MNSLKYIKNKIYHMVYPSRCSFCRELMDYSPDNTYICSNCMKVIKFCINKKRCKVCSTPLNNDRYKVCYSCYRLKQNGYQTFHSGVTSAVEYDDNVKYGIVSLKQGKHLGCVSTFASLIKAMILHDFSNVNFDIVVAVPPTKARIKQFGFDQADVLAKAVAKLMKKQYVSRSLKRIRDTKKQTELKSYDRYKNVSNAFGMNKPTRYFAEKTVLVIDDVCTTGATLNECARVLTKAGAKKVYCATIAKTVK